MEITLNIRECETSITASGWQRREDCERIRSVPFLARFFSKLRFSVVTQNLQRWLHGPAFSGSVVTSCKLIFLENLPYSMLLGKEEVEIKTATNKKNVDLVTVRTTKLEKVPSLLTIWEEKF